MKSKFSRRFRKDDEHMGKHINLFETKTKEELLELYKEFLEVERKQSYLMIQNQVKSRLNMRKTLVLIQY